MTASDIPNVLREAQNTSGIDRESLLLHALKLVFETHVTTEEDWKSASRESQDRWSRQMTALLNQLEFCTAGAEVYAGQPQNLSQTVQDLKRRLAEHQATSDALLVQKNGLERQLVDTETVCSGLQGDCRKIQRRIEALKTESDRYQRESDQCKETVKTLEAENARRRQFLSDQKNRELALSAETGILNQDVAEQQRQIHALSTEITRLREEIKRQDANIKQLTDEYNLLTELQRILPEHHKLEDFLGIDRVHALANSDLIKSLQQQHGQLHALHQQINAGLEESDLLLSTEIGLNQKQWDNLRQLRF
jgi:chromosome segregation ATPase